MTYPLSTPVVVGDATEADQYNNLRRDALYLGGDPAGSGNLLQLLSSSMGTIELTLTSPTTIRLTADQSDPVGVMIGGTIFAAITDLTVTLTGTALPAAGRYYVYAIAQSDGSFILDAADNNVPDGGRRIGTFLWDGSGVVPGTLHNSAAWELIRSTKIPAIANGRLTLASGVPVPESDITSADTLYFTPYRGNEIGLYVCGEWEVFSFSELSLSLSGLTNELPYDIFLSADSNGLSLTAAAWGSVSARLTALMYQDGVRVSSADPQKRFLGTICKNSSGNGEDSLTGRLVWNEYNRTQRPMKARLTGGSGSGSYSASKWMPYYNGTLAPVVRMLVPTGDTEFTLTGMGIGSPVTESDISYSRYYMVGIGKDPKMTPPYDSNTNSAAVYLHSYGNAPVISEIRNFGSEFTGYHKYALMFYTNASISPQGENSAVGEAPGLYGKIYA